MNKLLKDYSEVKNLADLVSYFLILMWSTPKLELDIRFLLLEVRIRHKIFEIKMNNLLKDYSEVFLGHFVFSVGSWVGGTDPRPDPECFGSQPARAEIASLTFPILQLVAAVRDFYQTVYAQILDLSTHLGYVLRYITMHFKRFVVSTQHLLLIHTNILDANCFTKVCKHFVLDSIDLFSKRRNLALTRLERCVKLTLFNVSHIMLSVKNRSFHGTNLFIRLLKIVRQHTDHLLIFRVVLGQYIRFSSAAFFSSSYWSYYLGLLCSMYWSSPLSSSIVFSSTTSVSGFTGCFTCFFGSVGVI
ncbi:hypothetical protein PsorP6_011601 [Peronosclerospora sorghi]|uniref:Uncharacterized protein n=1 Tax=Peronosclerospora sorghi TaxID=230839 RepID=A0ACC0WKV9_9STRA|nr:hypothetical protein PsorP6_011601 [Peronosclerospora sorghi]